MNLKEGSLCVKPCRENCCEVLKAVPNKTWIICNERSFLSIGNSENLNKQPRLQAFGGLNCIFIELMCFNSHVLFKTIGLLRVSFLFKNSSRSSVYFCPKKQGVLFIVYRLHICFTISLVLFFSHKYFKIIQVQILGQTRLNHLPLLVITHSGWKEKALLQKTS